DALHGPSREDPMALSSGVLRELERIVGTRGLVATPEGRMTYECDMHTFYKGAPDAVVLPESTVQVAAVVRRARREHVAVVPGGRSRSSTGSRSITCWGSSSSRERARCCAWGGKCRTSRATISPAPSWAGRGPSGS